MVQLVIFVNLFFVPAFSLYMIYRKRGKSLQLKLELLLQYCIIAACNIPLTKIFIFLAKKVAGVFISIDSGYYTLAALLSAFLIYMLYTYRDLKPNRKYGIKEITHTRQSTQPQKIKMAGSPLAAFIILTELFVTLFMSFPRLDDLTWGSVIGIERLSTWFAGYNGRYIGNIIVIILTRLPEGIRTGVELLILCVLLYYVHRLLPKKEAFCFFALALLCLPLPVFAQSVVWTSGFANYTTSAVIMLFSIDTYCRVVMRDEKLSPLAQIVFVIVSFLGQLILENTAFYIVVLAGCFLVYGLLGKRKLYVPAAAGLISAVCGAVLMFSNSSYHSALTGDGNTYKAIGTSLLGFWRVYQNDIVPHLVQNNHMLNVALSIVLMLLWAVKGNGHAQKKTAVWTERLGCLCGGVLTAFFIYDMMDSTMTRVIVHGATVYAVVALFYAAYILTTIFVAVTDDMQKSMLLIFACSQVVLAAPLVAASPLGARCFFQNGILWCMLLGMLVQILLERWGLRVDEKAVVPRLAVITQIACAFYLILMLCGQTLSWQIQRIRLDITQACIESGAETIVLPEVPWSSIYCYGANISNSNDYWLSNYKRYYGIPSDTKLEFMDYYKWVSEYGEG